MPSFQGGSKGLSQRITRNNETLSNTEARLSASKSIVETYLLDLLNLVKILSFLILKILPMRKAIDLRLNLTKPLKNFPWTWLE